MGYNKGVGKTTSMATEQGNKKFSRFFPVPAYLEMAAAGVHITDDSVRVLSYERSGSGLRLGRYATRQLPSGTVKKGAIADPADLADTLRALKRECGMKYASAALPEEEIYLFKARVPYSQSASDMRNAVEFVLEENIPISRSETDFDFEIVPGTREGAYVEVVVSALPRSVVRSYADVFSSAGIVLTRLMGESHAAARALVAKGSAFTELIVHVDRSKTGLYLVSRGIAHYSSVVPIGYSSFVSVIRKHFSSTDDEAAEMIASGQLLRNRQGKEIFSSALSAMSAIRDEAKKLSEYWKGVMNKSKLAPKLKRVICSGTASLLPGLAEYVSIAAGCRSQSAAVWGNALSLDGEIPDLEYAESLDYAIAAGLAIPSLDLP